MDNLHFNMPSDDQNSFMNQLWDNLDDQMITPSGYDLIPYDQMITPSGYDLIPYDQMITLSDDDLIPYDQLITPSSYDHLIPPGQMITPMNQPSYDDFSPFPADDRSPSMNLQPAYDPNPSSNNPSFNIIADDNALNSHVTDDEYLANLPIGFRFLPTDGELVVGYLKKLVNNEPLPPNKIYRVNVYDQSPQDLAGLSGQNKDNEWYFFSPYKRKNRGSTRAERTTPNGYWKASSGDTLVSYNGEQVGNRKTLVYYEGRPGTAKKTHWIMHEYRLKDPPPNTINPQDNIDMLVCRIHNHSRGNRSNDAADDA